ncbi:MAG: formimidoylglutamase [Bacteroidota bacterium]|nr:formimidoylglutamase [Bacteroidota bacterium]MDX5504697.1 formimidoylglutamase [Bacteroidota bacterium]
MIDTYLAPVRAHLLDDYSHLSNDAFRHQLLLHDEMNGLPDLEGVKVALIGVQEDRGTEHNQGCANGADDVRTQLYGLYWGNWPLKMADLGNIYKGETIEDTYFAVQEVVHHCLRQGVIPILIGGSQDITYANYRAYDRMEQTVNLVSVDSRLDLGQHNSGLRSDTYLSYIILNKPYNLFNFSNLGYQTYFANQDEIDLMDRMFFDLNRLGQMRKNIGLAEPIVRDADMISIDISSVRWGDAPSTAIGSPNGFSGEEICAIARYCGLSDKVSSLGIYEYNPEIDEYHMGAMLIAQMIWYFLDGVSLRTGDYPFASKSDYTLFRVLIDEGDHELIFYKSPMSERWWIEVPIGEPQHSRHTLIPCSYDDYRSALEGEIPDRWWKARQKALA